MHREKFQIKIRVKDLYRFLMYYNYKSIGGVVGVLISVVSFGYLLISFQGNSNGTNLLLLVVGLLFTVIQPLMLLQKSAMQATQNPGFRNPLEYEIGEQGVVIRQSAEEVSVPWENIVSIVETKKQILVYTSRVNACIWPKDQFAEQQQGIKQIIAQYMEPQYCKWHKGEKMEE